MPDPEENSSQSATPPKGDFEQAEKYISKLVQLIDSNKIEVLHTDLRKFDPSSLEDHYRLDLSEYQIEISHSKQPNTGKDSYVMLFTNLKNIREETSDKVILAYTQLSDVQFAKFKVVSDRQIEERRKAEEEKRFASALTPIDQALENLSSDPTEKTDTQTPDLSGSTDTSIEEQRSSSFDDVIKEKLEQNDSDSESNPYKSISQNQY